MVTLYIYLWMVMAVKVGMSQRKAIIALHNLDQKTWWSPQLIKIQTRFEYDDNWDNVWSYADGQSRSWLRVLWLEDHENVPTDYISPAK